jgi:hypothetical protein
LLLLPVVCTTGAAADQWPSQGVPSSILLQKPFAPAQLVTAVSQLLNAGSPANCTSLARLPIALVNSSHVPLGPRAVACLTFVGP